MQLVRISLRRLLFYIQLMSSGYRTPMNIVPFSRVPTNQIWTVCLLRQPPAFPPAAAVPSVVVQCDTQQFALANYRGSFQLIENFPLPPKG
jgi:hypothetical protein